MIINRLSVGLALYVFASVALGDIWSELFREKLREADNGNPEAQYDVGTMYQNGRGVEADRDKAIMWFERSAAQGDAKAKSRLKLMKANAARFGKMAVAAAAGDSESQYELGSMYMKGVGTNINYPKAVSTFEQAARQGHVKAAYKLGLMHYDGTGVRKDGKKAFRWFQQAADNSYPAAQYYLGKMYAEGSGVKRDRAQALVWLGKAVDGGFDQARGELISVTEAMKSEPARVTSAPPAAKKEQPAPPRAKVAKKVKPAAKKSARKRYSIEDVMLAAWTRDGEPVSYLPSTINTCRTENDRVVCFSDDQMRHSGENVIKYKTKTIIDNFSGKGTFRVTYRNLVIDATQITKSDDNNAGDELGSLDQDESHAYKVKTGWSNPHTLECTMKNKGTVSCLKNNTYSIVLISPTTLAAGE